LVELNPTGKVAFNPEIWTLQVPVQFLKVSGVQSPVQPKSWLELNLGPWGPLNPGPPPPMGRAAMKEKVEWLQKWHFRVFNENVSGG
jgi:hypothetical protein